MANYILTKNATNITSQTLQQLNSVVLADNTNNFIRRVVFQVPPSCSLAIQSVTQSCVPVEGDAIKLVDNTGVGATTPVTYVLDPFDANSNNILDLRKAFKLTTGGSVTYIIYFT